MKISKIVKTGLSIALFSILIGCGDTEEETKDTSENPLGTTNSNGSSNSNGENDNNLEEEARIKASTIPFIMKMKTFKNLDNEDILYIRTNYFDDFNYSIDWEMEQ